MRPFAYMNDFTLNGEQPVMVPIKLQSLRDIVQYLFTDMNEGEFESDYEFKKLRSLLDEFNLALEKAEFEARQEKTKLAQIDPRLKIIANHYGLGSQLFKLIEESAELIVAITHIHHNDELVKDVRDAINEELADVKILTDQVMYLICQHENMAQALENQIEFKIERQLKRIADGENQV